MHARPRSAERIITSLSVGPDSVTAELNQGSSGAEVSVNAIESQPFGVVDGSSNIFDTADPAGLSDVQLTERVVGYASQIAALTAQFFDLLVEFDNRGV
jgi:hypothetical protein